MCGWMQAVCGTGGDTFSAADALRRAGNFMDGKPGGARPAAGSAEGAVFLVPADLQEAETVEAAVDGSQRTEVLAERTEELHREQEKKKQNSKFPEEQSADLASQLPVGREQRQRAHQSAGWTQVFTECRYPGKTAEQEHRAGACEEQENQIFSVFEDFVKRQFLSLPKNRDSVEQILHQPERTQPSAYRPSEKASEEKEEGQRSERNLHSLLIQQRLQRAHRAAPHGAGTGIAVQSRDARVFQFSPIDFSREEAVDVSVCQYRIEKLYRKTQSVHKLT